MTERSDVPVSVPFLRATRVRADVPYVGMKTEYVLGRVESGHSTFWAHGRVWEGRPRALVVLEPGDVHRDLSIDSPVTYQLLFLPEERLDLRVQSTLAPNDPRGAALHRLHDAVAANADTLTLEVAYVEALDSLREVPVTSHAPTRSVRRALELLRERYAEPISLDELSAHAGQDKFHLCRAFRAQVGMPPHAYLTELRIHRARALLAKGAKPRDVAPQVGLYDQSQLNRHFRRIVGMTPGQFRARVM
ncbi:MAG: AraC family transcriptional regulator [Archangium sp.]